MDARTGFLDAFTHAGGKQARSAELKRNLIAVLIAGATNLGLTRMAEASGISYDTLAWTAEWHVREETLREANLAVVGYHQRLPLAGVFGGGTLSSSDGQRFPTRGKSLTARALSRYFADEGLSTYTHVSDQHATYGTKVIVATDREAHYVLDEILGNATDLPITEHATDTHGVSLVNFALFDLVGLQLSPRIRDLGKITLYRAGPRQHACGTWPTAGPLLTRRLNTALIAQHWDEVKVCDIAENVGERSAEVTVQVHPGALTAADLRVDAICGTVNTDGELRVTAEAPFALASTAGDGVATFRATVPFSGGGRLGYAIRLLPFHPGLAAQAGMPGRLFELLLQRTGVINTTLIRLGLIDEPGGARSIDLRVQADFDVAAAQRLEEVFKRGLHGAAPRSCAPCRAAPATARWRW